MTEKSDDAKDEMSDKKKETLRLHVAMLGGNGLAICDCKAITFHVVMQAAPNGDNIIIALICSGCSKDLRVPFFHDAAAGSA